MLQGPNGLPTGSGPLLDLIKEAPADISTAVGGNNEEVGRVNSHVRFATEDSDLSDFSDSVGNLQEEQERKVLQKVKSKHKKKQGGGKSLIVGTTTLAQMADLVRGSRGKRKKTLKVSATSSKGEQEYSGRGPGMVASGLGLILDGEDGTQVPESPLVRKGVDPLKKVEASSLFGIKNELGISFSTPVEPNTDRLENMEVRDVEKKEIRESRPVFR